MHVTCLLGCLAHKFLVPSGCLLVLLVFVCSFTHPKIFFELLQ